MGLSVEDVPIERDHAVLAEEEEQVLLDETDSPNERSRVFNGNGSPKKGYGAIGKRVSTVYDHNQHHHSKPKEASSSGHGHGHSHGDLNMRGVFLHVLGDALGNLGVIASALIIWLTTFQGRYYFDPGISLVITLIILWSAIPLCKAASRILLQAVPVGMSVDEITADIEQLPRVIEAHHLHVWQLSDTKLVASLHVKVDCEVEGTGSQSYMHLAREIRGCLHAYGIHSSTIQPEFTTCSAEQASPAGAAQVVDASGHASPSHGDGSKAGSLRSACLLDCSDNCADKNQCCPPDSKAKKGT